MPIRNYQLKLAVSCRVRRPSARAADILIKRRELQAVTPADVVSQIRPRFRAPTGGEPLDSPGPSESVYFLPGNAQGLTLPVPDDRLDIDSFGIEFWVSANGEQTSSPGTIIALGDAERRVRLSLQVAPDGSAIHVWNGTEEPPKAVPAKLRDGRLHHVVVALRDGFMHLIVDGTVLPATLQFTPSDAPPERLTIGTMPDGAMPLIGRVARLRFWSFAPTVSEIRQLRKLSGEPSPRAELSDSYLGGFVDAKCARESLCSTWPAAKIVPASEWWAPIGATDLELVELETDNADFTPRLQPSAPSRLRNAQLEQILAEISRRQREDCGGDVKTCEQSLRIEAAAKGREEGERRLLQPQAADDHMSYPLYRIVALGPLDATTPIRASKYDQVDTESDAGDVRLAAANTTPEASDVEVSGERIAGLRIWEGIAVRGFRLRREAADGQPDWLPLYGSDEFDFRDEEKEQEHVRDVDFAPNEDLIGVSGTFNYQGLVSLRFRTTRRGLRTLWCTDRVQSQWHATGALGALLGGGSRRRECSLSGR